MPITKSDINKVLKAHGYGFVKVITAIAPYDARKSVVYKDPCGSTVKGIFASGIGPLTVTDEWRKRIASMKDDIKKALCELGMEYVNDKFIANGGTKDQIMLTLYAQDFPKYSHTLQMDPGYRNFYLVPTYIK